MGGRSHVTLYSELLGFLESRGRSLSEYDSAERGLSLGDAGAFLVLLSSSEVPILGMDVWRAAKGRLTIDGLESWYSTTNQSIRSNHQDALQYLTCLKVSAGDVLTVQFG